MNRHATYHTLAALALLACATACSDSDVCDLEAPQPMSVIADCGEVTRATTQVPLDGAKYTMWVNACFMAEGSSTPANYFSSDFLKFDYNPSSDRYIATDYYYPLSGSMRFTAIASNKSAYPSPTVTRSGGYISKLTLNLTSTDGLTEVAYADYANVACPAAVPPSLHFRRPQAALYFRFIPADELSCKHIIINSIELKSLQWRGTLNVTYSSTGTATHTWSNKAAKADYTLNVVAKGEVPAADSDKRMRWNKATDQAIPLVAGGDGLHILSKTDGRPQIIIRYTVLNDPTTIAAGGVGGAVSDDLLGRTDDYARHLIYVIDAEPTKSWDESTQYYYNITVHGNAQMDVEKVSVIPIQDDFTGTTHI